MPSEWNANGFCVGIAYTSILHCTVSKPTLSHLSFSYKKACCMCSGLLFRNFIMKRVSFCCQLNLLLLCLYITYTGLYDIRINITIAIHVMFVGDRFDNGFTL